jgi:hypothetical protein
VSNGDYFAEASGGGVWHLCAPGLRVSGLRTQTDARATKNAVIHITGPFLCFVYMLSLSHVEQCEQVRLILSPRCDGDQHRAFSH